MWPLGQGFRGLLVISLGNMKLKQILDIKYPIIQGGMAHIASGDFAAAVSEAGALGTIAAGGLGPEDLRLEIQKYKSITDKPYAVNLMIQSRQIDQWNRVIIEEGVKIVTTGAGNPSAYIDLYKNKGIKVFPVVPNATLAIRMARLDIDGIIIEGMEAGGHIGSISTMVALEEVRRSVDLTVIAAGGIGTGSQMLAAEALGADGVQIGTMFLGSTECPIHQNYKDRLIRASSNHTTIIGDVRGFPARVIRNPLSRKYQEMEKEGKDKWELEEFLVGGLKKAVKTGDMDEGSFMAGQTVGLIKKIRPIKEILEELYSEYQEKKEGLCTSF